VNVAEAWSENLEQSWVVAVRLAKQCGHGQVGVIHWLMAVIQCDGRTRSILSRLRVDPRQLLEKLGHQLVRIEKSKGLVVAPALKKMLIAGYGRAYQKDEKLHLLTLDVL
jgi:ATP-dependent Clp protease ATP-binding subunit ClpA